MKRHQAEVVADFMAQNAGPAKLRRSCVQQFRLPFVDVPNSSQQSFNNLSSEQLLDAFSDQQRRSSPQRIVWFESAG